MNAHRAIAGQLRLAAALADHHAEEFRRHARDARALAQELESDEPPSLEDVRERGVLLFSRPPDNDGRFDFVVRRA